jgi:aryl-alcohol dehydrogenase-like predicted oxidoreductase
MTLPTRRLGDDGPAITTLGFGAWAAGGGDWAFSWGPQDDADSLAAMRRAIEIGVNWIDTAAVYGLGHSEKVVGQFLRELPAADRPLVFTKCGLIWDDANPMAVAERVLRPASIRKECETSLRRLGVERIDLYQFHWPDQTGTAVEDSWDEMSRLIHEGKIRWAGVSNFDIPLLQRTEARAHVTSLQPPFSMIRREAESDLIPWCRGHGVGVICYSPLQAGILTDRFSRARVDAMDPADWRRNNPHFKSPQLERNIALRDALRPIADRHGCTTAAVALAWVLSIPGVTGAIVGARSAAQVEGWIGGARVVLSGEDQKEIGAVLGH